MNIFYKAAGYPLKALIKSKPYQKYIEQGVNRKTIDNAVAIATLGSIVAKDGIGCAMYVTQSKNNKKIPEERRDFVWKLDAVNGILMMGFQILFFLGMRKFNDKIFNKLFKSFNKKNFSSFSDQIRVDQKKLGKIPTEKSDLLLGFDAMKHAGLSVFRSFTELVASTILAKRVVVPFIATYLTDKMESNHKKSLSMTGKEQEEKPVEESAKKPENNENGKQLDVTTNLLDLYNMKK